MPVSEEIVSLKTQDNDSSIGETPLDNLRHEQFCVKFAETNNATESYAYAFNKTPEQKQSSNVAACTLKKRPEIIARIEYLKRETLDSSVIQTEFVVKRTTEIAYFNPKTLYDAYGTLLPPNQWPDESARVIKKIYHDKDGNVTNIELHDKMQAVKLLAGWSGMDKQETKEDSFEDIMMALDKNRKVDNSIEADAEVLKEDEE